MNKKLYKLMNWADIEEIIYSECDHPDDLLGPHKSGNSTLVQAYFPGALSVSIKWTEANGPSLITPMEIADDDGYFAVLLPEKNVKNYTYKVTYEGEGIENKNVFVGDPYRHSGIIKENDIKKFTEGKLFNADEIFGAHVMEHDGEMGVHFALWAPGAMRVSVVGDFNGFDGRVYQMKRVFDSVFELFIPGNYENCKYQYEIKLKGDIILKKNDPYASRFEDGVSVISEKSNFKWSDKAYLAKKKKLNDMIIYEVSYDRFSSNAKQIKKDIATLVNEIKDQGFTSVLLNPIALSDVKERICTNFFEVNPYICYENNLKMIVNSLHEEGISVIFKWMPSGFGLSDAGLKMFDGTYLYEHANPKQGLSADGKKGLFQYGRGEVISFLMSNGLYLLREYHADGICVSGVATMLYLDYGKAPGQWVPNIYGNNENLEAVLFIRSFIKQAKSVRNCILVMAEDSSTHQGMTVSQDENGIGFDYKWNEGFIGEYFDYISHDPIERGSIQNKLTDELVYSYAEKFILPLTDELLVKNGGLLDLFPGNEVQRMASLRLSIAYSYLHPGYKLVSENFNKSCENLCAALNKLYTSENALCNENDNPESFEWLSNLNREGCYVSFVRKTDDPEDMLVCVCNFAGIEQTITTGVPYEGKYKEVLNTDSAAFSGSGIVNGIIKKAVDTQSDGRAQSISIKLAPLSLSVLKFIPYTETELAKVIEERIRRNTPIKKSKKTSSGAKKAGDSKGANKK
ncbi:MAG: alpha amylase C-terminal domain-containing protein [Lachnospiraceae bacterium]|nr:alpha amylase C-terminal domain-containing protein [Lachnospiraceae bacterium]